MLEGVTSLDKNKLHFNKQSGVVCELNAFTLNFTNHITK